MSDHAAGEPDKAAGKGGAKAKAHKAALKAQAKADRLAQKAEAKAEKDRVKTLAQIAEAKLLKELKASLDTHARAATFACGGSVSFRSPSGNDPSGAKAGVRDTYLASGIDPIEVRFGQSGKGVTPASFGRDGKEVLDLEYRKAGKLDKQAFATTFCPYEAGIVDVVSQPLLPQTSQYKHMRGVKAELYKLNVYSAPSGKFKAHVDTPRSDMQIGSLVVALPVDHQGGELVVRNAGSELVFDWSTGDEDHDDAGKPILQWAAFYSDCEHEVYEVTAGHRITLTYNLYVTRGLGHLAGSAALNATQLPLYEKLQRALESPGFLRRGRVLAVWLTQSYAHTNKHVNFLPHSLKGADMSLYETACALGLKVLVVPVMTLEGYYDDDTRHLLHHRFPGFNEGRSHGGAEIEEYEAGWGSEMPNGKVTWLNATEKKAKTKGVKREQSDKHLQEVQLAYTTYGNEPGIGINYSRAAMLLRVPPFHERGSAAKLPESIWAGVKRDYDDYYDDDCSDYEEVYEESYSDEDMDEESEDEDEDENEDKEEDDEGSAGVN